MNRVIDASIVVKTIIVEEQSVEARALVRETIDRGDVIVAPAFMRAGILNTIRRLMIRNKLPYEDALYMLNRFFAIPFAVVDHVHLYPIALDLCRRYSLSAYDALYIALAQDLDCDFWTADERIVRAVGGRLPFVRSLATYSP